MDLKDKIKQAEQYARAMIPLAASDEEQIRNRIANQFFGEDGIPPALKQGWIALEQRRKMREQVGYPLPPGGCFILGYQATVAGLMAELHTILARTLKMDPKHIKMQLMKHASGSIYPAIEIDPPKEWLLPITMDIKDPKVAEQQYLRAIILEGQMWWHKAVKERMPRCDSYRRDLRQPIAPWVKDGEKAQKTEASNS